MIPKIFQFESKAKFSALFTSVNLLLGVGPLILPMPFFNAGIALSILWILVICLLSYNSAMFISQSMRTVREIRIKRLEKSQHSTEQRFSFNDSLITSNDQDLTAQEANQIIDGKQKDIDHTDQFEILFSRRFGIFPCICISIYLLGTSISKCIMTGKIMKDVFINTVVLNHFQFWICLFFVSGAAFSFRSIDKTKIMQVIIVSVRALTIGLFLGGAIYLIINHHGVRKVIPEGKGVFNIENFVEIFSNSVFSLMFHHSLPGIIQNLNVHEAKFVIRNAFIISGSVLMIIPITGVLAFGKDLIGDQLKYYNDDFKEVIPFIYYITSFYVFLNIAAFSVYIIVIRTNILHIINPSINPKKLSQPTISASLIILGFILFMSQLLQQKIQIVLDFTGGIFGILILFIIPCIEVFRARKVNSGSGNQKKYIWWLPVAIGGLGIAFMGYNLYRIIDKLVNHK